MGRLPEFREGNFVLTTQVTALYGSNSGPVKVTYKAPKGKVIVLMAVEVASGYEDMSDTEERCAEKVRKIATGDTEFPLMDAEESRVVVPMRISR